MRNNIGSLLRQFACFAVISTYRRADSERIISLNSGQRSLALVSFMTNIMTKTQSLRRQGVAPLGSSMRSPVWWIDGLSRRELGSVSKHRVHDDRQAASQSDTGLAHR